MKKWPYKSVAFLEGDNLKVFCNLSASEIRSDKRVAFGGRGLITGGLLYQILKMFINFYCKSDNKYLKT
jgi:hypothetical protein